MAADRVAALVTREPPDDEALYSNVSARIRKLADGKTIDVRLALANQAQVAVRELRRPLRYALERLRVREYVDDLPAEQTPEQRAISLTVGLTAELSDLPPRRDLMEQWHQIGLAGFEGTMIPVTVIKGAIEPFDRLAALLPLSQSAASGDARVIVIESFVSSMMTEAIAMRMVHDLAESSR